jgi:hypothetical protein
MATIAHCLFCFDVLSARLDKRKCLSLNQVQDLWDAYNDQRGVLSIDDDDGDDGDDDADEFLQTKKKVKIQKEGPESSSKNKEASSSRAGSEEEEEGGKVNEEEPQRVQSPYGSSSPAAVAQKKEKSLLSFPLALPSISRLRDSSRSGSGSGSNSSTPSTLSTASSRSALTESSSSSSSSVNDNNNNNNNNNPSSVSSVSSISSSPSSSASSRRPYLFAYRTEQQDVDKQYPLFVTWNTISSRGTKSLRGCIGTFDPTELSQGLKSYALTAYVFVLSTLSLLPSFTKTPLPSLSSIHP